MGKLIGIISAIFVSIIGILSGLLKIQKAKTKNAKEEAERAKVQNKIDSIAIKKMEEIKEKQDNVETEMKKFEGDFSDEKYKEMVDDWNNGN